MTVKLWSGLPRNHEANGFTTIEKALIQDPHTEHVVIAVVNRKRLNIEDDRDEEVPVARITQVEVIPGDGKEAALQLLRMARKLRTGSEELPFEEGGADL